MNSGGCIKPVNDIALKRLSLHEPMSGFFLVEDLQYVRCNSASTAEQLYIYIKKICRSKFTCRMCLPDTKPTLFICIFLIKCIMFRGC